MSFTLIAGRAYDRESPVQTFSPMIYLDVQLSAGAQFTLPDAYSQQAVYSVTEALQMNGMAIAQHRLAVLKPGTAVTVSADRAARCIVVGGEPECERHKWNKGKVLGAG